MAEIILHHYELSTFSEKIRAAFGFKKLPWRSVDTPPAPPRPQVRSPSSISRPTATPPDCGLSRK